MHIKGIGWIELGGAGVLRKEVTEPLGIRHLVLVCWYGDRVSVGVVMVRLGLREPGCAWGNIIGGLLAGEVPPWL